MSRRLQRRRRRAAAAGDGAEVARLSAMESAVRNELVPAVCPDAVSVAGEAARAAHLGLSEKEWRDGPSGARVRAGRGKDELDRAIRLLKAVELWPWPERQEGLLSGRRDRALRSEASGVQDAGERRGGHTPQGVSPARGERERD